ncbi:hypothetical protein HHI36_022580 [Cryptolaemus montrouzieri]|uniref:Uncharacterized protein n=1 Tax=Cryptolaemus montrouzieri TaxID=559131 RepID=A0ABD2N0N3_9CUCU
MDLSKILNAFDEMLLTVNYDKTYFMPFSCYSSGFPLFKELEIEKIEKTVKIATKETVKYLGVLIDQNLRWDYHIELLVKSLRSLIYLFRFLAKFVDFRRLKMIYHGLVECRIRYGITIYGTTASCYLNKV